MLDLYQSVRDAKIKILSSLKRGTEEERTAWDKFSASLKAEYPKYTPLLAKILEGILSGGVDEDKFSHKQEIIDAANEVIDSIDREELAKYLSVKSDPEDEEAEKIRKKIEVTRDQLAEALYRKGLALADIISLKIDQPPAVTPTESNKDSGGDESVHSPNDRFVMFEDNFRELKKWVDIKSSKFVMLLVVRERLNGRLGTALKVLSDMIQDDSDPPKKKLYDLKIQLLDEIGWTYLALYERQWMHVRFPSSLPIF